MDDKIIVSNRAALTAKYGSAGVGKIKQAVTALIAADAKRGIKSRLVYLDDAVAMKSFKGKAVTDPVDPRQNKEAIDAIFKTGDPDYLMILGAIDVVPHQDMANPVIRARPMIRTSSRMATCPMPAIRRIRETSPHSRGRPASWGGCRT